MPSKRAATAEEAEVPSKVRRVSTEAPSHSTETAYDSDQEPKAEMAGWRLDPEESHSDWTIDVVVINGENDGDTNTDTYHVHKYVLAAGHRKSEYFCRLFGQGGGRFVETASKTSRIELGKLAAEAFPNMLDFMYGHELNISSNNATALHYLGQYFEIQSLRFAAKQFWQADIKRESYKVYYDHARIFQNDKILKTFAKRIACGAFPISVKYPFLFEEPDLNFWVMIAEAHQARTGQVDCHSFLADVISLCKKTDVDADTFHKLTYAVNTADPVNLIPHVARKLLATEQTIVKPDPNHLTSIQKQCADGLAGDWENLDQEPAILTELRKYSPLLLTEILSKVVQNAKCRYREMQQEMAGNAFPLDRDFDEWY